jgi:hypothetical protein
MAAHKPEDKIGDPVHFFSGISRPTETCFVADGEPRTLLRISGSWPRTSLSPLLGDPFHGPLGEHLRQRKLRNMISFIARTDHGAK